MEKIAGTIPPLRLLTSKAELGFTLTWSGIGLLPLQPRGKSDWVRVFSECARPRAQQPWKRPTPGIWKGLGRGRLAAREEDACSPTETRNLLVESKWSRIDTAIMQPPLNEPQIVPAGESGLVGAAPVDAGRSKRPFTFRFVVGFGPQLSTPCSRSIEVGPHTLPARLAPPGSMFQRHLRCHTFGR